MNTIINSALDLVNQNRLSAVVQKASPLVDSILNKNAAIATSNARISQLQIELKAVSTSDITDLSVMGGALDSTTAAGGTIAHVLAQMNKAKQDEVACKASRLSQAILNEQATIETLNQQIAKLRTDLSSLTVETVTETQVVG